VAPSTVLGSADFFVVDGRLFRRSHRKNIAAHLVLADAPSDRARFRDHPLFCAQDRAFHGIFHILLAALQRHPGRPARVALVVGAYGAVYCRRVFSAGRDTPGFCSQPHCVPVRFAAGFNWRSIRVCNVVSVVSMAISFKLRFKDATSCGLNCLSAKTKGPLRGIEAGPFLLRSLETSSSRRRLLPSWDVLSFLFS
jgi:hypothetical protein